MPRTGQKALPRVGIRIPKPMTDEIKRIIEETPELYLNRQQFVESAVREEIKRIKLLGGPDFSHSHGRVNRVIDQGKGDIVRRTYLLKIRELSSKNIKQALSLSAMKEILQERGIIARVKAVTEPTEIFGDSRIILTRKVLKEIILEEPTQERIVHALSLPEMKEAFQNKGVCAEVLLIKGIQ